MFPDTIDNDYNNGKWSRLRVVRIAFVINLLHVFAAEYDFARRHFAILSALGGGVSSSHFDPVTNDSATLETTSETSRPPRVKLSES